MNTKLNKISLRKANKNDSSKLVKFFESVDKDFVPPLSQKRDLRKLIRKRLKEYLIVLEMDKKIEGISTFTEKYHEEDVPHINELAVIKNHRHEGFSKLLLTYIFDVLKREGYKNVTIRTWSTKKL